MIINFACSHGKPVLSPPPGSLPQGDSWYPPCTENRERRRWLVWRWPCLRPFHAIRFLRAGCNQRNHWRSTPFPTGRPGRGGGEQDKGKRDQVDDVYHFFPLTEGLVTVTVNVGTKEGYREKKEDRLDTGGRQNNPQCSRTRLTHTALSSRQ